MRVWIRNLTRNYDKELILPVHEDTLQNELKDGEYIIIDYDVKVLSPGQYDSIDELNNFLLECKEDGIEEETIGILSRVLLYHEVMEHIRNGNYTIVDFDAETSGWNCGSGGNFWNDDEKGRVLHDLGYCCFNWEREFPIVEEMEDDIAWENLWTDASCSGWHEVRFNDGCYLVCTR